MRTRLAVAMLFLGALLAVGCKHKPPVPMIPEVVDYDVPLPPGQLALRKITDPRMMPNFTLACAQQADMRESIARSLNYLAKPSSRKAFPYGDITHEQAVQSLRAFLELMDANLSPVRMNDVIRQRFDVYSSVGCDGRGKVLFTGYYTPILDGSPTRTDRFKCPLYKAPPGLEKLPDGSPRTPMHDRKTIEATGEFAGNEIVWLADPFETFVAHIQGSAVVRMPNGQMVTYGYAANNGYAYNSIRAEMVREKRIPKQAGLAAMIEFFRAHPDQVATYTARNPRYIFFQTVTDGRPRGCLNEPVTTGRSIATDKSIFPPACLAMISADMPRRVNGTIEDRPYQGFALDQDAGSAIRAAGRCDVYMGIGPSAGQLAGRTQNEGRLYYLFLKSEHVVQGSLTPATQPTLPK